MIGIGLSLVRFSLTNWLVGYGPSFNFLSATSHSHLQMSSHPDRNHQFLFSLLGLRGADSARKVMIRRVYDVCMHSLCLGDVERARRAFGILLRCKEFDWKASWALAIYMLNAHDPDRDDAFFLSQVEQLRLLMLQDPTRVSFPSSLFVLYLRDLVARRIIERNTSSAGPERSLY